LLHTLQKMKKGIYTAFYAIILAHSLIWIETGPTDLVVWAFFVIGLLLIVLNYTLDSKSEVKTENGAL